MRKSFLVLFISTIISFIPISYVSAATFDIAANDEELVSSNAFIYKDNDNCYCVTNVIDENTIIRQKALETDSQLIDEGFSSNDIKILRAASKNITNSKKNGSFGRTGGSISFSPSLGTSSGDDAYINIKR